MFRSRLFGFVAVTLCLLFFVCAHGEGNRETAKEKVKEAKNLTDKVLMKVQWKYRNAKDIKEKVELRKEKAEKAANDAKTAAKDNAEAVAIAEKAKTAFNEYLSLYEEAKQKAQDAFDTAEQLLAKARQLDNKAQKLTVPDTASEEDYTKLINSAADFKKDAEEIDAELKEATKQIDTADNELWTLSTHAKDAQVAKYQVDAIVKVVEMETMLSKAEADIKVIEQKQNEVNAIVEAIKELFKNISDEVLQSINRFLTNAESDLSRITNSVKKVKAPQEEMLKQKNYADEALKEIKQETDESKAKQKLESINFYANNAAEPIKMISEARQSAVTHAELANKRKTNAEKEIAKQNSRPNGKDGKTAEKPQTSAKDKGANKQTKKATEQTVENKPEQSVENVPIKPADKGTEKTVENKTEKPAKDKTKGPVNKGGIWTSAANNDNAITVAFSLPLFLMFVAALH